MKPDGDTLCGLCDLGFDETELGYVSLAEIQEVSEGLVIRVKRAFSLCGAVSISFYARTARSAGHIPVAPSTRCSIARS